MPCALPERHGRMKRAALLGTGCQLQRLLHQHVAHMAIALRCSCAAPAAPEVDRRSLLLGAPLVLSSLASMIEAPRAAAEEAVLEQAAPSTSFGKASPSCICLFTCCMRHTGGMQHVSQAAVVLRVLHHR